ncbi:MAG: serine/threonine protein kinase [Myxococcales bacterium]|nr:serine/threonine protein kinase [Myxococcales bacterium]
MPVDSQESQRYDLLGEIATGGMATVYVAKLRGAHGFARTVAVKCMHPQYAKDPSFVDMFLDEARVAAKIRHPNVVPTLDIVREHDQLLIVLEYVEGETLSALLKGARKRGERIEPGIACAVVHDLLCGLHAAHEATDDDGQPLGIVHRDVSPQNVIVGADGLSRVLDFGVAKASGRAHETRSGEIKGKVPYMPVEQLYGEELDRRADVYAAGVVLWETLTGERLFDAPNDAALVIKITESPIPSLKEKLGDDFPAEIDRVVMRALSREKADRYASALEMAEDLGRASKLASRLDVAAFVKEHAGTTLAEREQKLRAWERTPSARELAPLARVVASALKDATTRRVSMTPTFAGVVTRRTPARRPTIAIAAGVVALLAVVTTIATVQAKRGDAIKLEYAAPAASAASAPGASGSVAKASAPAPERSAAAPAPAETEAPRPAATPARPAVAPARPAVAATAAPKPSAPPATPAATSVKDSAACRPPYTVDAEGNRHYKVECL